MQVEEKELKKVQSQIDWTRIRLRELREQSGFTQKQVGEAMGISDKRVWDVESGRHDIKMSTVYRYLLAIGVTVDKFIEGCPRTFDYKRNPLAARGEEFAYVTRLLDNANFDSAQWREIEKLAKEKRAALA